MTQSESWFDIGGELRRGLAEGLDVAGTIEATDILTHIGATTLELIIDVSDLGGADQSEGYHVLCDLMATRIREGVDQVLGCLLFSTEPDAGALVDGLDGMRRDSGVFTPVIPLSRDQAEALVQANLGLFDLVDDATSLIGVAVDRRPPSRDLAETLLSELDELIDRRT